MAIWAGVQNESRPIERCQAISQCTPIMAEVTPKTESQMYQGILVEGKEPGLESPGSGANAKVRAASIGFDPIVGISQSPSDRDTSILSCGRQYLFGDGFRLQKEQQIIRAAGFRIGS